MEEKIKIREARVGDAAGIQNVVYTTWLDTYPNEKVGISTEDIRDFYADKITEEAVKERDENIKNLH